MTDDAWKGVFNFVNNECTCDPEWLTDSPGSHYMGDSCPFVDCDRDCRALRDPKTLEQYVQAYTHWKEHPWLYGCSHGR